MSKRDDVIKRPKGLDTEWKIKVGETLRKAGLVASDFTGVLEVSLSSGGVASVTKKETLR